MIATAATVFILNEATNRISPSWKVHVMGAFTKISGGIAPYSQDKKVNVGNDGDESLSSDPALSEYEKEAIFRMSMVEVYTTPFPKLMSDEDLAVQDVLFNELEQLEDLVLYLKEFDIQEHTDKIAKILESNPSTVRRHYEALVPTEVSHEDFWMRYFFRCDADRIERLSMTYEEPENASVQHTTSSLMSDPVKIFSKLSSIFETGHKNGNIDSKVQVLEDETNSTEIIEEDRNVEDRNVEDRNVEDRNVEDRNVEDRNEDDHKELPPCENSKESIEHNGALTCTINLHESHIPMGKKLLVNVPYPSVLNTFKMSWQSALLGKSPQSIARQLMNSQDVYLTPLIDESVTSCQTAEDLNDVQLFLDTFDIEEKTPEIVALLENEASTVGQHFFKLVPMEVSYKDFWQRYFYRVDLKRIEQQLQSENLSSMQSSQQSLRTIANAPVVVVGATLKAASHMTTSIVQATSLFGFLDGQSRDKSKADEMDVLDMTSPSCQEVVTFKERQVPVSEIDNILKINMIKLEACKARLQSSRARIQLISSDIDSMIVTKDLTVKTSNMTDPAIEVANGECNDSDASMKINNDTNIQVDSILDGQVVVGDEKNHGVLLVEPTPTDSMMTAPLTPKRGKVTRVVGSPTSVMTIVNVVNCEAFTGDCTIVD